MECKTHHIPVNACHCKELCDFLLSAVVQQDNVVIGVTSSGVQHKQAGRIAQRIDHKKHNF